MSLSSFHGSRLPASAPGIWRPRLPTRDREIAKRWHESHRTRDAFFPFFYFALIIEARHAYLKKKREKDLYRKYASASVPREFYEWRREHRDGM